jgi:hypothetical protein
LLEDVRRAYEDGLVDPGFASLEGIVRDLRSHVEGRRDRHYIITDAIGEMEWWASFHPEDSRPKKLPKLELPDSPQPAPPLADYVPPQPFVRESKIGRNDPCSCGSGKKYKKCCGKG